MINSLTITMEKKNHSRHCELNASKRKENLQPYLQKIALCSQTSVVLPDESLLVIICILCYHLQRYEKTCFIFLIPFFSFKKSPRCMRKVMLYCLKLTAHSHYTVNGWTGSCFCFIISITGVCVSGKSWPKFTTVAVGQCSSWMPMTEWPQNDVMTKCINETRRWLKQ